MGLIYLLLAIVFVCAGIQGFRNWCPMPCDVPNFLSIYGDMITALVTLAAGVLAFLGIRWQQGRQEALRQKSARIALAQQLNLLIVHCMDVSLELIGRVEIKDPKAPTPTGVPHPPFLGDPVFIATLDDDEAQRCIAASTAIKMTNSMFKTSVGLVKTAEREQDLMSRCAGLTLAFIALYDDVASKLRWEGFVIAPWLKTELERVAGEYRNHDIPPGAS